MKKSILFFSLNLFVLLTFIQKAWADDFYTGNTAISEKEFISSLSVTTPEVLTFGKSFDCGDYKIQLKTQPYLTKSTSGVFPQNDLYYLVFSLGITNKTEKVIQWLEPDSFYVTEVLYDTRYGTYNLDYAMSLKVGTVMDYKPFYSPLFPNQEVNILLVFEVFPEVDTWIFEFSPRTREEEEYGESFEFTLPKARVQ